MQQICFQLLQAKEAWVKGRGAHVFQCITRVCLSSPWVIASAVFVLQCVYYCTLFGINGTHTHTNTHTHTHTLSTTCLMRRCTNSNFGAGKGLWKPALAPRKKHSFTSEHSCSIKLLIFPPYRLLVEFAFAVGSRPFLLLFQYVRALFEWGHPLPTWPGASSTSADLIESTTWVKFKQAATASPWQPHYSTLRTHSRMDCDSVPDKCWKGMKSNKRLYFWKDYCTSLHMFEGRNSTLVLLSVNGGGCLLAYSVPHLQ